MAIYKIFPEKDAFILSNSTSQNTGRDEVLEISNNGDTPYIKRALIQFNSTDISDVINNQISGAQFQSNLNLYLANASNLPLDYTIEAFPLIQSWGMGTGKISDFPKTTNGVSWNFRSTSGSEAWNNPGGDFLTSSINTQNFTYTNNKDISINVTNVVQMWDDNSIDNNGFILKLNNNIESSPTTIETSYFSMDTHTIYPPHLEFKWDDSIYSSSIAPITSNDFVLKLTNIKSEFENTNIYKFKLKVRDTYPIRSFQTSSIYLDSKIIPPTSYWGLKDIKTGEMVVDFDTSYTKISADNNSNYFTVYMDGLEPERYYQVMVKTIVGEETIVIEDKTNYFKVVR